MEIGFTLTTRLMLVGLVAFIALMVLLFALGFVLGHEGVPACAPA